MLMARQGHSSVDKICTAHIHMYMFYPYVISTIFHLLEELQVRTFKRYFSHVILLTSLHLRDMN
jgi:hypothetical protein